MTPNREKLSQRRGAPRWYTRYHIGEFVLLLHFPFSTVPASFVVIGGLLPEELRPINLILTLVTVESFLQASHMFDEALDRPWGTEFPEEFLLGTGSLFLALGSVSGVYLAIEVDLWLIAFLALGGFFSLAYSLELLGGAFHNPLSFGASWGSLVFLSSFYVQSPGLPLYALLLAVAIGMNGAAIVVLYEATKSEETRGLAWRVLKMQVVFWNLAALSMVIREAVL